MQRVEVEWFDSKRWSDDWVRHEDAEFPHLDLLRVKSLGWLVYEDDDLICVTPHDGGDQFLGAIAIPRQSIFLLREI